MAVLDNLESLLECLSWNRVADESHGFTFTSSISWRVSYVQIFFARSLLLEEEKTRGLPWENQLPPKPFDRYSSVEGWEEITSKENRVTYLLGTGKDFGWMQRTFWAKFLGHFSLRTCYHSFLSLSIVSSSVTWFLEPASVLCFCFSRRIGILPSPTGETPWAMSMSLFVFLPGLSQDNFFTISHCPFFITLFCWSKPIFCRSWRFNSLAFHELESNIDNFRCNVSTSPKVTMRFTTKWILWEANKGHEFLVVWVLKSFSFCRECRDGRESDRERAQHLQKKHDRHFGDVIWK